MFRKTLATLFVSAIALVGLAGPAAAAEVPAPQVKSVSPVVHIVNGNTAVIHGVYKCSGNIQAHLWVSAKQGSTSGSTATAWYDTNWNFLNPATPQGLTANCDGKTHSVWVTLHPNPFPGAPTAPLKGLTKTYIQFCLVTDEVNEIVASKAFWGHTGFNRS